MITDYRLLFTGAGTSGRCTLKRVYTDNMRAALQRNVSQGQIRSVPYYKKILFTGGCRCFLRLTEDLN